MTTRKFFNGLLVHLSPEIVTYPTTFPPTESTLKESVETTAIDETRTTRKEEVEKTTRRPHASGLGSYKDVATKWKIAFGACVAIIVILLAGTFHRKTN